VADAYGVGGTPSAVVVRPDGTIGSALVSGGGVIGRLVSQVAEAPGRVPLLLAGADPSAASFRPGTREIGEPAPEIVLPDLEANRVSLEDYRGEETLLLFWSPDCGFCMQMLPELKEWEKNSPEGAPNLVVVSTGAVEANEALGFRSTVVLDQERAVMQEYGAIGTPAAVLVDAEGRIASEMALGAPAVLELAGFGRTTA
jgi:thiol-disulfide isomerase/thioredoxin